METVINEVTGTTFNLILEYPGMYSIYQGNVMIECCVGSVKECNAYINPARRTR